MINPPINTETQVTVQSPTMEAAAANPACIVSISQASLNDSAPLTANTKGLELVKYIANKAKLNQKPTLNQIKILSAATNAMEKTRENFNHVRVNVHASQDPTQLVENARKLQISRSTTSMELGLTKSITFDAAISEQLKVGNCGEHSALDYAYLIEDISNGRDVGSADMLMTMQSRFFFENGDHICNLIKYKETGFELDIESRPRPHWVNVKKTNTKSIIMDSWAYGSAVLEEDYKSSSSMSNTIKNNEFPLKDYHYDENPHFDYSKLGNDTQDAAKKFISNLEIEKEVVRSKIPNAEEYFNQDHSEKILMEKYNDLGKKFMCDEALLQAPSNSLQREINFVVAAKEVTGSSTKDAVKLFKKIKFTA